MLRKLHNPLIGHLIHIMRKTIKDKNDQANKYKKRLTWKKSNHHLNQSSSSSFFLSFFFLEKITIIGFWWYLLQNCLLGGILSISYQEGNISPCFPDLFSNWSITRSCTDFDSCVKIHINFLIQMLENACLNYCVSIIYMLLGSFCYFFWLLSIAFF